MSDKGNKGFGKTLIGTGTVADILGETPEQPPGAAASTPTPTAGVDESTLVPEAAQAPVLPPQTGPSAPRSDADLIGSELGGYRIIAKVDEGGMGVVYAAEHPQIGKRAAIKLLKPEHCQNENTVERFYQEARAVNSIGHENIVDVFDFGRDDQGRVFFVMEFLEGEPLSARIRRGPLSWREGQALLEQILAALAAAHAADIVHRDLKPENIFLRRSSDGNVTVRLLDFGIAKFIDLESVQDRLTRTGSMIGTPQYMSPEQINGSAAIDGRADIYSLGVIIYEMFTGRRPFDGETLGAVIKAHLLSPAPEMICEPRLGIPGPLAEVVKRMLAKRPEERYRTVAEVGSDLRDVAANRSPTHAGTLNRTHPLIDEMPIPPAPRPSGARNALNAFLALLIVGLIGAGVYLFVIRDSGESGGGEQTVAAGESDGGAAGETDPPPAEPAIDTRAAREEAQSVLAETLKEAEPKLRVRTCDAYGLVRDRGAVDRLVALLGNDPDDEVRGHAAQALGRIGDERAVAPLADAAKAASEPLDIWFHEALARLGDKKSRRTLERATRSKVLPVSVKATFALADLSEPGDRKAVGALTRLASREAELNDVVPYAGVKILGKLARLRHGEALETLYKALAETNEGMTLAAARELARLGDDTGRETLQKIHGDSGSPNRLVAARALVSLGDYSGFDTLTAGLESDKPADRIEASFGLGEVGENKSIPGLLKLAGGSDKMVAIAAATAVLRIVGLSVRVLAQASVNWTKSALASDDWTERAAGARTLGDIPEADSLPLLAAAIADPEPTVRREASRSAAKLKSKAAAKKIASAVVTEKDAGVKETQVKALAAMRQTESAGVLETIAKETGRIGVLASGALIALGKTEAIKRLDSAIADRKTEIRVAAIESAGIATDPVVVGTVKTALDDRVFEVRLSAAEVLAEYGAAKKDAIAVLREALTKKKPELVSRAHAALLRIGEPVDGVGPAEMLASDNPKTRMAALSAIAALEWGEAESLLRRALADDDAPIRARAVELLERFEASDREGVTKLYRKLTGGADPLIRAKAQARLARMLEIDKARQTAADRAATDKKALAELEKAAAAVETARGEFEPALAALAELSAELARKTAKPAEDEAALERVEKLTKRLASALKEAKTVRKRLRDAVSKAKITGAGIEGGAAEAILAKLDRVEVEVGEEVAKALRSASSAVDRAEKYAVEETADPTLYLTSAKTALATGQLGAARRDLRKAQKLFKERGRTPPDLWFAYGELYRKLARGAKNPAGRKKQLERAKSSYERFVRSGRGFQVARAKEAIRKITAELAKE